MSTRYRPGHTAPRSGEWKIVGPRGGQNGPERTVTKGEPFPPTPKPNSAYVMSRPARNAAGRGK